MNRPSMMTRELTAVDFKAMGKFLSTVAQLVGAAFLVAMAFGFRAEKPGARLDSLEHRVTALEKAQEEVSANVALLVRLQCLGLSRRDAQIAGACEKYPTKDESTRVGR